jgi:uncharacterized protein YmfQ (DUF2313 family)
MMQLLARTAAEYAQQFQRLLPRGPIWHRGLPMTQDGDIEILMPTWSRLHQRLNDLIGMIFPCEQQPPELLAEWEATLGLPDPCIGELDTVRERINAVCVKFSARGGQSKDYFIAIAAALGVEITITEFRPFEVGLNRAGDPLYGEAWAHAWEVNFPSTPMGYFSTGISTAGDPLRTWGNKIIECVLDALKPAHTILIFSYGSVT